jgi:hypothetical protein
LRGLCGREVLGDLEALYQIELPREANRRSKIYGMKVFGVDQKATFVDIALVHSGY